jgi:phosphoglycerate dehydrogenase-like enzyme
MKVLVYHRHAEDYRRMIRERFPDMEVVSGTDEKILFQHIADADMMIAWRFPIEVLKQAGKLRWIQLTSAGIDHLFPARESLRDVVVTNTRGIHADIMADYAFAAILMCQWDFPRLIRQQEAKRWIPRDTAPLAGKTLGIVGVGAIGSEIARRAQGFHMNVVGVKRNPLPMAEVNQIFGPDHLHKMLSASDFVVILAPATPETYRMIGESELRAMKRTAYLVNIARGTVVVESALVRALQENWIAGAVLDVFEKEPLPDDSPLWTLENVLVTPHLSGNLQDYANRVMAIFTENYQRWKAGKQLLNVVELEKGY